MSTKSGMPESSRILSIKEAPFSWKERDLLTAAERFMSGAIDLSIVSSSLACFPEIVPAIYRKLIQTEWCYLAAFHLQTTQKVKRAYLADSLPLQAARIYEQEAQRLLGSVFSLDDPFWNTFYIRQETIMTRPIVVLDALYFLTQCQEKITHQLLVQAYKAILSGFYEQHAIKKENFKIAKRLLVDHSLPQLTEWLNRQSA